MEQAIVNRDRGIETSAHNAEIHKANWQKGALDILRDYISVSAIPFLAEDVRLYAEISKYPVPPSKRAWGAVFVKAYKLGLIHYAGYGRTKNPLAHRTPATLWIRATNFNR